LHFDRLTQVTTKFYFLLRLPTASDSIAFERLDDDDDDADDDDDDDKTQP
jgi:hypothetical protein